MSVSNIERVNNELKENMRLYGKSWAILEVEKKNPFGRTSYNHMFIQMDEKNNLFFSWSGVGQGFRLNPDLYVHVRGPFTVKSIQPENPQKRDNTYVVYFTDHKKITITDINGILGSSYIDKNKYLPPPGLNTVKEEDKDAYIAEAIKVFAAVRALLTNQPAPLTESALSAGGKKRKKSRKRKKSHKKKSSRYRKKYSKRR